MPEDYSGRELSTRRQMAGRDKCQGHTHTPPPASPHSYSLPRHGHHLEKDGGKWGGGCGA